MSIPVSDVRSSPNEQIWHAAKVLGRSRARRGVFQEIYRGKRKIKTVSYLETRTGLSNVRVLQEAGKLADNDIVARRKVDHETGYEKIRFYEQHKNTILSLSLDRERLKTFPTKYGRGITIKVSATFPRGGIDTKYVTVDDIDSFRKVRRISPASIQPSPAYERRFKRGLQRILGERGDFKDWGGENDDLYSTRVTIDGKRHPAAFGLKGRGTRGPLTPEKMGKRGDQIQRLFRSPADVFFIQYWGRVAESIIEQMRSFSIARSALERKRIYYGAIDGTDTVRLRKAYPQHFG